MVLTSKGGIWTFGENSQGQLGASSGAHKHAPRRVEAPAHGTWKAISAGRAHSLALLTGGVMYAWGQVCAEEAPSASFPGPLDSELNRALTSIYGSSTGGPVTASLY